MNSTSTCPECRQLLHKNKQSCICGWKLSQKTESEVRDYRCVYSIGNRRCPLPGNVSPTIHANGNWYCSEHWRARGNRKLSEIILGQAEQEVKHKQNV